VSTPEVSLVVTTYGGETYHTQHCLGRIRQWKQPRHELIVVCHDETPTLRAFLELCRKIGLVDELILAVPGHGHVRGVNLGFERASAPVVFNVCIDMRVGGDVVAECAERLRREENVGVVGWHYDWSPAFEGTFWRGDALDHELRRYDDSRVRGELDEEHVANIRSARWFTGRVFDAIGTRRILCFNGSFFGVRKHVWDELGGFDERLYPGHWADDFFAYALLDRGLDVANIPAAYRCGARKESFEALTDLGWQGRHDPYKGQDRVDWKPARAVTGLTADEVALLEMLERCLDPGSPFDAAGDVPWIPARGRRLSAHDSETSALLLATRAAYRTEMKSRLATGGTLVVFDAPDDAGLARAGSLGIHRADAPRAAFVRRAA
jgi:GT2 family glycosyltransferase